MDNRILTFDELPFECFFRAKDIETLLGLWTDDCVLLVPGLPPIQGKDAMWKYLQEQNDVASDVEILEYVQDFKEVQIVDALVLDIKPENRLDGEAIVETYGKGAKTEGICCGGQASALPHPRWELGRGVDPCSCRSGLVPIDEQVEAGPDALFAEPSGPDGGRKAGKQLDAV